MKTKKSEIEIDTIGGLGSLTLAEEKALSEFFVNKKENGGSFKTKKKLNETKNKKLNIFITPT